MEPDDVAVIKCTSKKHFYSTNQLIHCFNIKDIKTGNSVFYMYLEEITNKEANEVCSMLVHYIINNIGLHINYFIYTCFSMIAENKINRILRFFSWLWPKNITGSSRIEPFHMFSGATHLIFRISAKYHNTQSIYSSINWINL